MDRKIYSVSELNSSIKDAIELEFGGETIWVAGEISGFKGHYASGHWYFSLKDKQSQISAVCFRGSNQQIKFTPENGMDVICSARVGVYEKDGKYQLYVSAMEPKGVGADALALEKLKQKLSEEGLFDVSKKRPSSFSLPQNRGGYLPFGSRREGRHKSRIQEVSQCRGCYFSRERSGGQCPGRDNKSP